MTRSAARWFDLDGVLAASTATGTFSAGPSGWVPANVDDVLSNCREISEDKARSVWGKELDRVGPPPHFKKSYSAAGSLAMARAAQRVGEKYDDPGLKKAGEGLEARALEAIKQGKTKLDPDTSQHIGAPDGSYLVAVCG